MILNPLNLLNPKTYTLMKKLSLLAAALISALTLCQAEEVTLAPGRNVISTYLKNALNQETPPTDLTIKLKAGTYEQHANMDLFCNTTICPAEEGANVTIYADSMIMDTVTHQYTGKAYSAGGFRVIASNLTINLQHLNILGQGQNVDGAVRGIKIYGAEKDINSCKNCVVNVEYCNFRSMDRGIYVYSVVSECALTVDHCTFDSINRGIHISSYLDYYDDAYTLSKQRTDRVISSLTVTNSAFSNMQRGVYSGNTPWMVGPTKIENCTFYNYDNRGVYFGNDTDTEDETGKNIHITDPKKSDITVNHCTFYVGQIGASSSDRSLYMAGTAGGVVTNNIFMSPANNSKQSFYVQGKTTTVSNNLCYNLAAKLSSYEGNDDSGKPSNENEISSNPKFTNPETGNFTLESGSPAINAGTDGKDLGNPTTDYSTKPEFVIDLNYGPDDDDDEIIDDDDDDDGDESDLQTLLDHARVISATAVSVNGMTYPDTNNLPAGIYVIRTQTDKGTQTYKIVK